MKGIILILTLLIPAIALLDGCITKPAKASWSLDKSIVSNQLKLFISEKMDQAEESAKADGKEVEPEFRSFFAAANRCDWPVVNKMFYDLGRRNGQFDDTNYTESSGVRLRGTQWEAVREIWGAFDAFSQGDEKYALAFGNDIIKSIPPGSIYFGGTDWGRFVVTALCQSHVNANPFFTVTQNALVDGSYLDYLRSMYGNRIRIPTSEDLQRCFDEYYSDAKQRLQKSQLKPGEEVVVGDDGVPRVDGIGAVMELTDCWPKPFSTKILTASFTLRKDFHLTGCIHISNRTV